MKTINETLEMEIEMLEHCLSLAKIDRGARGDLSSFIRHLEEIIEGRRREIK